MDTLATVLKIIAIILSFLLMAVCGNIPIYSKSFRNSPRIMSYAQAFSGGLFLALGLTHILPEAQEKFEQHYKDIGQGDQDHYPMSTFIVVATFALILLLEKVITDHNHHEKQDTHKHTFSQAKKSHLSHVINHQTNIDGTNLLENPNLQEEEEEDEEQMYKREIQPQKIIMNKISIYQNNKKSMLQQGLKPPINWTPYLLQLAVGIHAIFEGLSLGIESKAVGIGGILIAIVSHKWAMGLTLGISCIEADLEKSFSTKMIIMQAFMTPIGVSIGWALQNQGDLTNGVLSSVSAGTFLYIAAGEVLMEEFSISRYKVDKYILFLLAIGFVQSFYFIEQAFSDD